MLVSIVMAAYNGERWLRETVTRALSQTYSNIEVIIINDGSTDSTGSILNGIKDERVTVIHLEQNRGAAHALNTGIKQARGSWIAINDADDFFFPNKIEEQVKYLHEHPELVGVGTLVECISERAGRSGAANYMKRYFNSFVSRENIRDRAIFGCPVAHSSMIYSKDLFWEVGGYDSGLKICYDYDLWLRLLEKGEIEKVPKVLLYYRVHPKSLSQRDTIKTSVESQIASSRRIYRQIKQNGQNQPEVIITGPTKACNNYKSNIAPLCGLHVGNVIDRNWKSSIDKAINEVNERKVDAILVLKRYKRRKILSYLKEKGLTLNKNIFSIDNKLK